MESLIAIVAGAVAVAVAPLVPAARPVAKGVVKGGLALGAAAAGAAAAAGKQIEQLRDHIVASLQPDAAVVQDSTTTGADAAAAAPEVIAEGAQEAGLAIHAPGRESDLAAATIAGADAQVPGSDAPGARSVDEAAVPAGETTADANAIAEAPAEAPTVQQDDLTRLSGIGPKTATLLAAAGITSYAQLAAASEPELRAILLNAGPRFRLIDPSAWPAQAGRLLSESAQ